MGEPFDVPRAQPLALQRGEAFTTLVEIMRRLLSVDGCPWDREQSFESLRRYVLEEAAEVVDAIDRGDRTEMCEELGDLLFQVVFQAELGRAEGAFGPDDVALAICRKLVRRHPHVFGDEEAGDGRAVAARWEAIKRAERAGEPSRWLDRVPRSLSPLARAQRLGERAAAVGFDWPSAEGPRAKVAEELAEVDAAVASGDPQAVASELGDLLFAVVNWARHLDVESDAALRGTLDKVARRFAHIEDRVRALHGPIESAGLSIAELDALWEEAKRASSGPFSERRETEPKRDD